MKSGDPLVDIEEGETPFKPLELIAGGEHYQIARAKDHSQDRHVAVRALVYDEDATDADVARRRAGLRRQWELLEVSRDSGMTPEPVALLELTESPVDRPPEPVIVAELIEGPNLYEWIVDHYPQGLEPTMALAFVAQLTDWLTVIHGEKWLYRDFDPRHFRVVEGRGEPSIRPWSVHYASKWKQPLDREQLATNHAYVAPEIREEVSGKMQRPAADLYGLGALLSFLLTGEEPRRRVESPLSFTAYERIESYELSGLELLLARLLQPLAKKRLSRAALLRPYCSLESLPTRHDRGFEMVMLPAPWLGLEIDEPETNRGLRSKLSAGPLVSVARGDAPARSSPGDLVTRERPQGEEAWNWPLVLAIAGITALIVGLAWLL